MYSAIEIGKGRRGWNPFAYQVHRANVENKGTSFDESSLIGLTFMESNTVPI
jgi:hypothetical protein